MEATVDTYLMERALGMRAKSVSSSSWLALVRSTSHSLNCVCSVYAVCRENWLEFSFLRCISTSRPSPISSCAAPNPPHPRRTGTSIQTALSVVPLATEGWWGRRDTVLPILPFYRLDTSEACAASDSRLPTATEILIDEGVPEAGPIPPTDQTARCGAACGAPAFGLLAAAQVGS